MPKNHSITPKLQAFFPKAYCVAVAWSTILVIIVNLQVEIPYYISLQFCINISGKKDDDIQNAQRLMN